MSLELHLTFCNELKMSVKEDAECLWNNGRGNITETSLINKIIKRKNGYLVKLQEEFAKINGVDTTRDRDTNQPLALTSFIQNILRAQNEEVARKDLMDFIERVLEDPYRRPNDRETSKEENNPDVKNINLDELNAKEFVKVFRSDDTAGRGRVMNFYQVNKIVTEKGEDAVLGSIDDHIEGAAQGVFKAFIEFAIDNAPK